MFSKKNEVCSKLQARAKKEYRWTELCMIGYNTEGMHYPDD